MSRPAEAPARLLTVPADGSEAPLEIWRAGSSGPARLYPTTFSPDGQTLCVFGPNGADGYDIFEFRTNADGSVTPGTQPVLLLGGPFGQAVGQVSPSGTWLLFASDATGVQEVYVTSYPGPGPVHRVSVAGGREPMWNPSRPEIVYLNGTSVYGVEVRPGRQWHAREPQMLFSGPFPDTPGFGYAMAPDGRFLMLENTRFFEPATTLNVITHVPDELRRRLDAASR